MINHPELPVICLMGPTASGKTQLAISLYQKFPFHIVSVDSAMVYRGMDIGTAKPSQEELAIAPHELIDICDPSESFSAGQFHQEAISLINKIHQAGKIPLLVGGTMLYFSALQRGLATLPPANLEIREKLNQQAQEKGWEKLHSELSKIDPAAADKIKPQDKQRIQRAWEVYLITGRAISEMQQSSEKLPGTMINLALGVEKRSSLHQRIEMRVTKMFHQGFIDEVKALYQRSDLAANLPAIRSVGYRQIWQWLENEKLDEKSDLTVLKEQVVIATRQLAKRQMTWLRSWQNLTWFDSESSCLVEDVTHYLKSSFPIQLQ